MQNQKSKRKQLIVIPSAGLGNRMRVLSSCVQIALKEDRTLWIVWPKNPALGCELTDIFNDIGIAYKVPPKWLHFLLVQMARDGVIKIFYKFYKFLSKTFSISTVLDKDFIGNNVPQANDYNNTLMVATCYAFGEKQNFKLFSFTEYLKNKTEQEYQKIGEPFIGVHIRRTDHVNIIKQTPFENYLKQIDKCLENNPDQKFYLATDDEATKTELKEMYKNKIFCLNYKLERTGVEGIQGAVIELLLLSKSEKIICSALSSYSDTAILLGEIKEVIHV